MKISVITPSFNQGEFIERTLQSVISQKSTPHEIDYTVMDGGSSDQTVDILKSYQDQLSWVSEKDKGQTDALNKGLQATSGEIIGWLNSDDIYYPDTIKKVCDFFTAHPDVDILYGEADFIDRDDHFIRNYPTEKWDLNRLKSRCFISQPAAFFRRRVVLQYGLPDESLHFCMDYEYWLRLGLSGAKFAYIPDTLAATRVYPQTKTASGYIEANQEAVRMLKKKLNYIPAEWIVSISAVKVRSKENYHFTHPYFVIAVWWNLWGSTAEYQTGLQRIYLWITAQKAMLQKFLRRAYFYLCKRAKHTKG